MSGSKDNNRLLMVAMVAVIGALVVAVLALVVVITIDDDEPATRDAGASSFGPLADFADSVIVVDEAAVGQWLDVSSADNTTVTLTDQSCDGDHGGEITWVGTFGDIESSNFVPTSPDDLTNEGISRAVRTALMERDAVDALSDSVEYHLVNEDAAETPDRPALCYATNAGGESFTENELP